MEGAHVTEPSLGTRVKTWFHGIPFATRAVFVVCVALSAAQILLGWSPVVQICLLVSAVAKQYQFYRLLTHAFFHLGLVHIAFNMLAFVPIGSKLERQLGTVKFLYLIFLLLFLSDCMYVLTTFLITALVGFSGVIFGLIVIHANVSTVDYYSILGLFPVPAKVYPWALLVFWQLLVPGVSFLGHLSGVIVGQLYVWKALKSLSLSDATVTLIERSLFGACAQWPNFILTANTSLPTHVPPTQGSRFSWTGFYPRGRPAAETLVATGGTTVGGDARFPGQPQYIRDPVPSASQTSTIPVIEEPQDDFTRLVEMGFEESSVRAALLASDGDFTAAMNKLTGAT